MLSRPQNFLFSPRIASSQFLYSLVDKDLHQFLNLLIGTQSTNSLETGGLAGALELIALGGWCTQVKHQLVLLVLTQCPVKNGVGRMMFKS